MIPTDLDGPPRVALVTYSTKPRGGVVHTLHLAEALAAAGQPVQVLALGQGGGGFFRPTTVPHTVLDAPPPAPTLEQRVWANVDALADGLAALPRDAFDVVHAQDCIASRAAVRVRDEHGGPPVLRTVHHIDDFTSAALVECQHRSVLDPDQVVTVSRHWRATLTAEYGIAAGLVTNGVDGARFARPAGFDPRPLRDRLGAGNRFVLLTVGGLEPRKGGMELIEALGQLRAAGDPPVVLGVVGGHSFQDHAAYREAVLLRAADLGLEIGRDVVLLGTVPDRELPAWYHAADAFVLPSVKEGWGLAVLEALAAGLPVVTSDIPPFLEFLTDEVTALVTPVGDATALAGRLRRVIGDAALRGRLSAAGPELAGRYTWAACADQHRAAYHALAATRGRLPA